MGYAWAPQITGLVRGEPQPGQKHRANGKAILMECCEERASKSPTLDRSRSHLNTYWHRDGGPSGTHTWDTMCADAAAYKIPVKLPNGNTAERGLGHNAVIGWAVVMKPPPEMVAALGMTRKDVKQFCADGFKAMSKIEGRLFRVENLESVAGHSDEADGLHFHYAGVSKDKNGKYCGNLVDANLCVRINQQWPALMREMGWPIDDLDMTDWARMKTDEAYRVEREAKRKRQGQSVEQFGKQKAAAAGKVAARIITDAQNDAQATRNDAQAKAQKTIDDADEYARKTTHKATRKLEDAERDAARIRQQAETEAQAARQEAAERRREAADIANDIERLEAHRAALGDLYEREKAETIRQAVTDAQASSRVQLAKTNAETDKREAGRGAAALAKMRNVMPK